VHKQSLRAHADGGKIFKITSDVRRGLLSQVPSLGWQSHGPCQLRILWNAFKGLVPPRGSPPAEHDEHAIYSERQFERPGSGSRVPLVVMMQVLRVQGQALSLIMGVRFLLGRHRRRGVVPERDEVKRLN
jgi:hypothetical protein